MDDTTAFRETNADWVALEHGGDDVAIYCLNPTHIDITLSLYQLDANSVAAERELAILCERTRAIGICADRFIKYSLLQPHVDWPSKCDLSEFLHLGWNQTDIAAVKSQTNPTEKINRRLKAAAGHLISRPAFLAERDALRRAWQTLPQAQRPCFPIARSTRLADTHWLDLQKASTSIAEFIAKFDEFCDEWHLLGMTTWELPDVRGPQWVPGMASDSALRRGDLTLTTPWHFQVLAEDGLGQVLEAEHRRQATERGVKDADSWETYASLLDISHWESVLSQRYSQQQRVVKFKTKMEQVLGEILGLSDGRVHKLRNWLHSLQSGKLRSLQGKR